jgi:hypothetical protein
MKRGGEDVQRFEDAIYEAKEAISEICEIYEEMKSQFSDSDDSGFGERYSRRYGERYGERYSNRGGSSWERRSRDSRGRYM